MKQYKVTKNLTKLFIAIGVISISATIFTTQYLLKADVSTIPAYNEGIDFGISENSTKANTVCINKPFVFATFFGPNSSFISANGKINICGADNKCNIKGEFNLTIQQTLIDRVTMTMTSVGKKTASSEYSASSIEGGSYDKLKSPTFTFTAAECDEKNNPIASTTTTQSEPPANNQTNNNSNSSSDPTKNNSQVTNNATGTNTATSSSPNIQPSDITSIGELLKVFLNFLFYTVASIAFINLLIAGIKFITSSGDAEKMAKAKRDIIYNVVGILIAVLSLAIVRIIFTTVNGLIS